MVTIKEDDIEVQGETMVKARRALAAAKRKSVSQLEREFKANEDAYNSAYATIGRIACFEGKLPSVWLRFSSGMKYCGMAETVHSGSRREYEVQTRVGVGTIWFFDFHVTEVIQDGAGFPIALLMKDDRRPDVSQWAAIGIASDGDKIQVRLQPIPPSVSAAIDSLPLGKE